MQVQTYRAASRELLEQARDELAKGDHRQASEKAWGAAAQIVKAVAQHRGWPHNAYPLLRQTVSSLVAETGDEELETLFQTASWLHVNYYENWSPPEEVQRSIPRIARLLDKLDPLLLD